MESTVSKLLDINDTDRQNNDKLAGLSEDGPVKYMTLTADEINMMTVDELL